MFLGIAAGVLNWSSSINEELKREAFLLVKQEVNCSTKQITITKAGGTELLMTFLQFNNCISKLKYDKTFLIHFRAIFTKCKHASNRDPYRERRLGLATESYTTISAFKRCNREFDLNYGLMKSQLSRKSWVTVFPVYIVVFFQGSVVFCLNSVGQFRDHF